MLKQHQVAAGKEPRRSTSSSTLAELSSSASSFWQLRIALELRLFTHLNRTACTHLHRQIPTFKMNKASLIRPQECTSSSRTTPLPMEHLHRHLLQDNRLTMLHQDTMSSLRYKYIKSVSQWFLVRSSAVYRELGARKEKWLNPILFAIWKKHCCVSSILQITPSFLDFDSIHALQRPYFNPQSSFKYSKLNWFRM